MNWSPKRSGERDVFTVNYGPILAPGETILAAAWSAQVLHGDDANASAMVQGPATCAGPKVSQLIVAGMPGTTYAVFCTAQTSNGRELILPDPGAEVLYVPS